MFGRYPKRSILEEWRSIIFMINKIWFYLCCVSFLRKIEKKTIFMFWICRFVLWPSQNISTLLDIEELDFASSPVRSWNPCLELFHFVVVEDSWPGGEYWLPNPSSAIIAPIYSSVFPYWHINISEDYFPYICIWWKQLALKSTAFENFISVLFTRNFP